jgi:hypothetical protein
MLYDFDPGKEYLEGSHHLLPLAGLARETPGTVSSFVL